MDDKHAEHEQQSDEDRWLSRQEAANFIGVGVWKFNEIRRNASLGERKLGHRTVRFSLFALRAFMRDMPKPKRSRGRSPSSI
jgi:hypothetical protein